MAGCVASGDKRVANKRGNKRSDGVSVIEVPTRRERGRDASKELVWAGEETRTANGRRVSWGRSESQTRGGRYIGREAEREREVNEEKARGRECVCVCVCVNESERELIYPVCLVVMGLK